MARVYLIRHGHAAAAWDGPDADPDPGLDDAGRRQADAACRALLARPEPPTLVVTSPLRRCRETAAPLAAALGLAALVEPRVAEIPTPRGLGPGARGAWLRDAFQGRWADIPGDLDYRAWRDAVAAAVAARPGAAVFSHFVAINAALSAALEQEAVMMHRPDNGSITVFETDGVRLRLVEAGREADSAVL